jgi:hypothetical protein
MWATEFHTHTKQQVKLYCLSQSFYFLGLFHTSVSSSLISYHLLPLVILWHVFHLERPVTWSSPTSNFYQVLFPRLLPVRQYVALTLVLILWRSILVTELLVAAIFFLCSGVRPVSLSQLYIFFIACTCVALEASLKICEIRGSLISLTSDRCSVW